MIEEKKYCTGVMKKIFNKEFVMTKKDVKDFENCTKCWFCDNVTKSFVLKVNNDFRVRNHCHITGKYGGSGHGDCNTTLN